MNHFKIFLSIIMFITSLSFLAACQLTEDNMTDNVNYSPVRHDRTQHDADHNGRVDMLDNEVDRERAEMMDSDYLAPDGSYDINTNRSATDGDRGEKKNSFEIEAEQPDLEFGEMKGKLN
jgi:hypothetical protein